MPVEPPVVSPRTLRRGATRCSAAAAARPIAGGTDLMVQLTGELGPPPERVLDLWRLDELRGIAVDGDAARPRRADDVHGDPPLRGLPRAPAGRSSRRPRRSARRRSRTAARSAATSPTPRRPATPCRSCSRSTRRSCWARRAASGRCRRPTSGPPTGGPRSRRTSCSLRIRIPLAGGPRAALPQGRHAAGPGDHQGRPRGRLARATAAWRDVRLALGSVAATPIRAAATEAALEGRPPTPETTDAAAETLGAAIHPIDDVRSTAEYRREAARRVVRRLLADAIGDTAHGSTEDGAA